MTGIFAHFQRHRGASDEIPARPPGRLARPSSRAPGTPAEEFEDVVPAETIGQVARRSLGELRGAKIPDFVPMFAWRRARRRLSRLT